MCTCFNGLQIFDKKASGSGIKNISNKELAEELHKPIVKKYTHLS